MNSVEATLFDAAPDSPLPLRGPRPRHALVIDQLKVNAPEYPRDRDWWQGFVADHVVVSVDERDHSVTLVADARLGRWCPKPPTQRHYDMYWTQLYTRFTGGVLAKYFADAVAVVDLP